MLKVKPCPCCQQVMILEQSEKCVFCWVQGIVVQCDNITETINQMKKNKETCLTDSEFQRMWGDHD